jgi:hypothetical protein
MAGEHTRIAGLFLSNIKMAYIFFEIFARWMKICDAWVPDN